METNTLGPEQGPNPGNTPKITEGPGPDVPPKSSSPYDKEDFFSSAKITFTDIPKNNAPKTPPPDNIPETPPISASPGNPPQDFQPKRSSRLIAIIAIIVVVFILLVGGAVWGMNKYEIFFKKVAIEKLLPNNPNLVAEITINPDSDQFQLLEQNLQKFPGYDTLQKELDVYGEGKTASQAIQDKAKKIGLDFQSDIKPLLGEKAYVVIPDLDPIGKNLKNRMLMTLKGTENVTRMLAGKNPSAENQIASQEDSRVLGAENDSEPIPLDFILASEIKDLKKAKEVMEKIKKDKDNYEVSEEKFEGYSYYKIKLKNAGSNEFGKYVRFQETYNAMLGGNWIISSNESYMKDMIGKEKQNRFFTSLITRKKTPSLYDDQNFTKVNAAMKEDGQKNFLGLYYNINYSELFKDDCPDGECDDITEYVKYPDNVIAGFMLRFDAQGIIAKSMSNQMTMEDFENKPLTESLSYEIPDKIADRWSDIVVEYSDLKKLYYTFKKNNLTEKGAEEWNSYIKDFQDFSGIDLERDFIDLTNGNLAFILLSKKSSMPEEVLIAETDSPEKMLETMKKIVESIKAQQIKEYESYLNYSYPQDYATSPTYKAQMAKNAKAYKDALEAVKSSSIKETESPNGKIYSYQFISPKSEGMAMPPFSLNFSLGDNELILSSSYQAVESILQGSKDGSISKISSSDNFKEASKFFYPKSYEYSYINTIGLYNTIDYFAHLILGFANEVAMPCSPKTPAAQCAQIKESQVQQQKEIEDGLFAFGAVLRTVKLIGSSSSADGKFLKSSMYFNIQEIPKEEKDRASSVISDLRKEMGSSRQKSHTAAFKSEASSLVPTMIIACDERNITADDIKSSSPNACIDGAGAIKTLAQSCGPAGNGTFSITFNGINDCSGNSAECTEEGCKFNDDSSF